ncbi:MAG: ParB/RepB/Spo0J family partition protein [Crinalium sp.]
MENSTQLTLLPEQLPFPVYKEVSLDEIPKNLPGGEPSSKFCESVKRFGVIEPVVLSKKRGKYKVIAGRRRIKAARKNGFTTIPAVVYEDNSSVSHQAILAITENYHREENTLSDLESYENLLEQRFDDETIADQGFIDRITIKKIARLMRLIPELKAAFKQGNIKPTVARIIATYLPSEQALLLPVLEENGRIKMDDLQLIKKRRAEELAMSLPAELFADMPGTTSPDWRSPAKNCLKKLLATIPESEETWQEQVKSLLDQL